IYKTGDFDGDGREDLFWRNESDGTNAIWYFRGGNIVDSADFFVGTPLAQWRIDATGDFDGDGHEDLMWFDIGNGSTVRWLMHDRGVTPTYETVIGIGTGWKVVQ
ncbi:MAG: VCBS repeat-containing protein, partial [Casimicrobiaceae bacterium]